MKHYYYIVLLLITVGSLPVSCDRIVKSPESIYREKIDSLIFRAKQIQYNDPLSARKLYASALAIETDSIKWYTLVTEMANTFLLTSEFDSIHKIIRQIHAKFDKKDNLSPEEHYIMSKMYNMQSYSMAYSSQNDSMLINLEKSLYHYKLSNATQFLPDMYINLADYYLRTGNFLQAISNFREGLAITDSIETQPDIRPVIHTGLGRVYSDLRNFELADYYYDLAFSEIDNLILLHDKFVYYNNRGNSYYRRNELEKAIPFFRTAFSLIKDNPEFQYQNGIVKSNLAEVFLLSNKLDSAKYYLMEANVFFEKTNNFSAMYHTETLLFEHAIRSKDLVTARQAMFSFAQDEKIEPIFIQYRKKYLQHYYETIQDYTNAYKYLKENTALDDSISNTLIKMRVEETDMRYQHDATLLKQTHMIEHQQGEMKSLQLNRYIWILASALLLLTGIFIYLYMRRQWAYLAVRHQNRIVKLRMENIRNRVSPHFIFNLLNHIISRYDRADKSYQELFNLIKLMRFNLTLTEKLNISLEEELDFVETYVVSRQQESGMLIDLKIETDDKTDTSSIEIPSMIIQIPIENSIKHGFRNDSDNNERIRVSVSSTDTHITIMIEDNGSGFNPGRNNGDMQSTGTGLKVINQTIQLLNSYNKSKIKFTIENKKEADSGESGCIITYIIPKDFDYNYENRQNK